MSVRPSCTDCARKHLAQAAILMLEAEQGYPLHAWWAVGHMGEAADELVDAHPDIAAVIREHRLAYMASVKVPGMKHYSAPLGDLIAWLSSFDVVAPADPELKTLQIGGVTPL